MDFCQRGGPGPRKLKLSASHPWLDRNCLPIFSKFFVLYYIPFTKLTSFKKQFLIFLEFFKIFFLLSSGNLPGSKLIACNKSLYYMLPCKGHVPDLHVKTPKGWVSKKPILEWGDAGAPLHLLSITNLLTEGQGWGTEMLLHIINKHKPDCLQAKKQTACRLKTRLPASLNQTVCRLNHWLPAG